MGKANTSSNLSEPQFVGSFFALDQLPKDGLPQIAIAGRSNVGKSSLLNRILGRKKLAKVSSTPGRTRSLNFFLIDNRFYLVDLPGYGYAKASKTLREQWGQLVDAYFANSDKLIGLVLLLDCRREPSREDVELLEWLSNRSLPTMVAITKSDKLSRNRLNERIKIIEENLGAPAIPFSSVSGLGKRELLASVRSLVEEYRKN